MSKTKYPQKCPACNSKKTTSSDKGLICYRCGYVNITKINKQGITQ